MTATADRDPGLQPERTRLAWRRTTLTATVVALLAGRQALHSGATPAALVAVALSALAWLGFLLVAHRRVSVLGVARPEQFASRGALTAALCTVALAVFAAAMLF
ncbi:DUF202 domain-containing protein [Streptomyces globisporus]|uniref:DUF202 domain-containing protein n=1 Tax=Streptomyces TaxID=1883 RepID=UPI00190C9E85|nr:MULTISPECIES: DUF202 domain-containing protein [unclassified Streptomyces]MBK3556910.1 DUF202 domain-containing protein [Streptomyces sp. MBT56]MBK3603018.1 DUF202 domain-containing protein [Streptomyces sp. MBT54]MBK3617961.1 DUF202 domain-containing protein [Streptomyces sp. MBT98]MBK6046089.1 DUF202 domain-containing protein [Streptomyces sp. MBT55]